MAVYADGGTMAYVRTQSGAVYDVLLTYATLGNEWSDMPPVADIACHPDRVFAITTDGYRFFHPFLLPFPSL